MATIPAELVLPTRSVDESIHQTDTVRILCLQPGTQDAQVICSTQTFPIGRCPEYIAVSYLWEDSSPAKSITVNNERLSVSDTIFQYLKSIRSTRWRLRLWIDAICTEYDNLDERARLVRSKGLIYRDAASVMIWLGPSFEGSEHAMDILLSVDQEIQDLPHDLWEITERPNGLRDITVQAIESLVEHQYWRRFWTFQDLVRANVIYLRCGERMIPFEAFEHLRDLGESFLRRYNDSFPFGAPNADYDNQTWIFRLEELFRRLQDCPQMKICRFREGNRLIDLTSASRPTLMTLLREFQFSSRPRSQDHDTIYSLVGLTESFRADISYSKSLRELSLDVVEESQNINVYEAKKNVDLVSDALNLPRITDTNELLSLVPRKSTFSSSAIYAGTISSWEKLPLRPKEKALFWRVFAPFHFTLKHQDDRRSKLELSWRGAANFPSASEPAHQNLAETRDLHYRMSWRMMDGNFLYASHYKVFMEGDIEPGDHVYILPLTGQRGPAQPRTFPFGLVVRDLDRGTANLVAVVRLFENPKTRFYFPLTFSDDQIQAYTLHTVNCDSVAVATIFSEGGGRGNWLRGLLDM